MRFLAHRGHWLERPEVNSDAAFERAWSGGFGIETDLRDHDGTVVISHDPPGSGAMSFETFLQAYAARGQDTPLALNIKADGLQDAVSKQLAKHGARNFFVFDMSVPDSLHYLRAGMPVFVRLSEYESETPLLDRAAGVWLDAFEAEWWTLDLLRSLHARGKTVAIVSSELHKRPHEQLWCSLLALEKPVRDALMLCTDFPDAAQKLFVG